MKKDPQWIITSVDGKIASVAVGYGGAAKVLSALSAQPSTCADEVSCVKMSSEELLDLSDRVRWEDLYLIGSPFRRSVWKALFDITHGPEGALPPRLLSYSDLAESIGKRPGVRSVAHAVGQNPVAVLIPCHLIIPKEALRRLHDLEEENSLFRWKTLYMVDGNVDYGEFAYGGELKRRLIQIHMNR